MRRLSMLGLLLPIFLSTIKFCSCFSANVINFDKVFHLDSNRSILYTIFTPHNAISVSIENSAKLGLEAVIIPEQCSLSALNRLNLEQTSMPVIVCGNENESMFGHTIHQIGAASAERETSSSPHWPPCYFIVWPTVVETDEEVSEIMNLAAGNYARNFSVSSQIYVVFAVNQPQSVINLWEFYRIGQSNIYREIQLINNRIQLEDIGGMISRRANFEFQTIRATAQYQKYFELDVQFKEDAAGNLKEPIEFVGGMNLETLQFLQDSFNFSIQPVLGTYSGDPDYKPTVGRIPDQLKNDIADISITEIFVTADRAAQLKLLHPTYADALRAVYINPPNSDFRDIFIVGFQRDVWIVLGFVYLVLIVTMKLFLWVTIHRIDGADLGDGSVNSDLYSESILFVVGVATQQGWHIQPESKSIRIIFLVGYLTGLVCFVAYSAAIVSTLSVKLEFVKSFENLLNKNYRVVTDVDQHPDDWSHEVPDLQGLELEVLTASEAMNKAVTSRATFITHADEMYATIRNQTLADDVTYTEPVICERVGFVTLSSSTTKYSMFLKKGSYLADFFNSRILRERECGVLQRLLLRHIKTGRVSCNLEDLNYQDALGLADVFTAFIILVVGYSISLLALVTEIFAKLDFKCVCNVLLNKARLVYGYDDDIFETTI